MSRVRFQTNGRTLLRWYAWQGDGSRFPNSPEVCRHCRKKFKPHYTRTKCPRCGGSLADLERRV